MGAKQWFLRVGNRVGLHVLPEWEYQNMRSRYLGPQWNSPPLPEEASGYLTMENPRLLELKRRYEGHPASLHTQWREDSLMQQLQLPEFRGENHYVYQVRYSPAPEKYLLTAYYIRDNDRFNLFGRLVEDGLFGGVHAAL